MHISMCHIQSNISMCCSLWARVTYRATVTYTRTRVSHIGRPHAHCSKSGSRIQVKSSSGIDIRKHVKVKIGQ